MKLNLYIVVFCFINVVAFSQKNNSFSFFVLGDMPYHLPEDYNRFENVIDRLNQENQVFNVFVGDFKSSKTPCSDEAFDKIFHYFNSFKKPLIYTPGDNEWTDCGKPKAGSYNTDERLTAVRTLFFKDPLHSLGQKKISLNPQSAIFGFEKFVENSSWQHNNVAFATIHIVGSNNNFDKEKSNEEFYERSKANIYWLKEIFKKAIENKNLGLVIFEHANMITPDKGSEGFILFMKELQKLVTEYKKPVLLINGDSHEFIVDKPLYENTETKKAVLNFTRLQVFGEEDMHAVKVTVNPNNPSLFEINQFLISKNQ